jgi:hypothetical protein
MEEQQNTAVAPQAIESDRLPYDAELFKQAEEFCKNALRDIPELGALAIVPVWITPPENMPPALLRFRNPMEPPMAGVLQLIENMLKFSQRLHKELIGQYQMFDQHAKELADKINEYSAKLKELENQS